MPIDFSNFTKPNIFDRRHLERVPFAHGKGDMAQLLALLARGDVYGVHDHFSGDTLDANMWAVATDAGATAFAVPAAGSTLVGGAITGATGTTDDEGLGIYGPAIYAGDNSIFYEIKFKVSAVTGLQFEVGLTDPLTDQTLPAVTDVDTPATGNGATDVAVVHMDTDQTLTTMAFVTDGTAIAAAKTNVGTLTPTADTYMVVRVVVSGNAAFFMVDDKVSQSGWHAADAIEGGVLLQPWAYFRTRNTTSKTVTIDRITCLSITP